MGCKDETSEMLYIICIIICFGELGIKCRKLKGELDHWKCGYVEEC